MILQEIILNKSIRLARIFTLAKFTFLAMPQCSREFIISLDGTNITDVVRKSEIVTHLLNLIHTLVFLVYLTWIQRL